MIEFLTDIGMLAVSLDGLAAVLAAVAGACAALAVNHLMRVDPKPDGPNHLQPGKN